MDSFLGMEAKKFGFFDFTPLITVRLRSEIAGDDAFHVNRPFVERVAPGSFHNHEFYECFWISAGSCLHFINHQQDSLLTGDLVFIRPADKHAFQNVAQVPCRMVNVAFPAETAAHLLARYGPDLRDRFFWSTAQMPTAFSLDDVQMTELRRLERYLDKGTRSLARIEAFLLHIMTGLLGNSQGIPAETPHWLATACEQMHDPETLRRGVPAMVELTGKSHEHVARSFRKCFGMSPSAYVTRLRMELAARQLREANTPIIDVAFDCGIEDLSHFYKLFRAAYGTSPLKYRRGMQLDLVHPPV